MGRYLMDGLRTLEHHPWVGDIRGKGLLAGVELVHSRETKVPVGSRQIQSVIDFCREDGLIVGRSGGGQRYSNPITLSPPLVIARGEIDRIVETLDRAIAGIPAAMVC
jgi:taurine-pyruvate aminotransferase